MNEIDIFIPSLLLALLVSIIVYICLIIDCVFSYLRSKNKRRKGQIMNEERYKLMNAIREIYLVHPEYDLNDLVNAIADYIIADRKRICEPLDNIEIVSHHTVEEELWRIKETRKRAGLGE